MKNFIKVIPVLLLFSANESFSQSVSVYAGYPYYFIDNPFPESNIKVSNELNYVFGISGAKYFEKVSIEIGYSLNSKNFSYDLANAGRSLFYREVTSTVHSIPILISPKLFSTRRNIFSLTSGVNILKTGKYSEKSTYKSGKTVENNGSRFDFKFGLGAILGMKYTRVIKNNFLFFTTFTGNYKFLADYNESIPANTPSDDKFSLSLNMGVELLLFNEIKYFTWHRSKGKNGF